MRIKTLLVTLVLTILATLSTLSVLGGELTTNIPVDGSSKFMLWAFILGGLSAISLVLGSMLGLIWQPSPKITAAFTAFGAGALLAALSVELVAPTVQEFVNQSSEATAGTEGHAKSLEFIYLIGGCILGGVTFYLLNEMLNSHGGYLRKVSTVISHFNHQRRGRYRLVLKRLSKIRLFRSIPPSHLDSLVQHIRHSHVHSGRYLIRKGSYLSKFYIIEKGEVQILQDNIVVNVLKDGSLVGESYVLHNVPAEFDAIALTDLKLFELSHHDLVALHNACPELQELIEKESKNELLIELNHNNGSEQHQLANAWADKAATHLHTTSYIPTQREINDEAKKHGSAPLSIWLGIFLDGIPESFVIGAGFLLILTTKMSQAAIGFTDVVPYTLIAGLFLSNFPEAMSSSIGMKKMGWKPLRILMLWTSLMIMTAVGAVFGYYYGVKIPNYIEIGVEGMAAGAMLTMISQTMIPEAVHIGGNKVTGLSTLAGYLAAVAFKVFE